MKLFQIEHYGDLNGKLWLVYTHLHLGNTKDLYNYYSFRVDIQDCGNYLIQTAKCGHNFRSEFLILILL